MAEKFVIVDEADKTMLEYDGGKDAKVIFIGSTDDPNAPFINIFTNTDTTPKQGRALNEVKRKTPNELLQEALDRRLAEMNEERNEKGDA